MSGREELMAAIRRAERLEERVRELESRLVDSVSRRSHESLADELLRVSSERDSLLTATKHAELAMVELRVTVGALGSKVADLELELDAARPLAAYIRKHRAELQRSLKGDLSVLLSLLNP